MPAWVEDAQQLTELRDLSSSQGSVLLRTTEVEEFLSNLTLSSHALVAPKGFGKTLVLKLKRISLQENDYRCFPFSPIVDRPSNKPPILPNEIINVLESSDNWETLWNLAFSICLIKGFQDDRDVHQQLDRFAEVERSAADPAEHPDPPAHHQALRHPARLPGGAAQRDLSRSCGRRNRSRASSPRFTSRREYSSITSTNISSTTSTSPICAATKSTNGLSVSGTQARSAPGSP